jgi:hypothetical protein
MPILYPDILEHNNSAKALVDITQLRGSSYPIGLLSETGSIPTDKRKLGAIVFVSSSQQFYGFYGQTTGSADWDSVLNWRTLAGGGVGFPFSGNAVITGSLEIVSSGSNSILTLTSQSNTLFQITNNITGNLLEVNSFLNPFDLPIFYVSSSYQSEFRGPVLGLFTGSLLGTASYTTQALSSSFATTASYAMNGGGGVGFPFSGSAVITGSIVAGNTPFSILNNTVSYNQTSSLSSATISIQARSNLVENRINYDFYYPDHTIIPTTLSVGTEFKIFYSDPQFLNLDYLTGSRVFYSGSITDIYGIPNFRYIGNVTGWNIAGSSTEDYLYALTASSVTATTLAGSGDNSNIRFYTPTGSGIINLEGYITASKSLLVNGPTTISGSTNIRGLTTITGSLNTSGSVNVTGQISASSYIGPGNSLSGIVANPMFENLIVSASITATGSLNSNGANALNLGTTNYISKSINLGQIETLLAVGTPENRFDANIITLNRNLNDIDTVTHTQINFNGRYWEYFPGSELYDAYADTGNHYLKFISKNTQTGNIIGRILDLQFSTRDIGSGVSKGFSTDYNGTAYFNVTGSVSASSYYGDGSNLDNLYTTPILFNQQTSSYTASLSDLGKMVELTGSSLISIYIPPNSVTAFPTGSQITFIQTGTQVTTFVTGSGVTLNSYNNLKTLTGRYSVATCVKKSTDTWYLFGDLS